MWCIIRKECYTGTENDKDSENIHTKKCRYEISKTSTQIKCEHKIRPCSASHTRVLGGEASAPPLSSRGGRVPGPTGPAKQAGREPEGPEGTQTQGDPRISTITREG